MVEVLFHLHLFVTFFMTGLIWFVQIVHYPLFQYISEDNWPRYADVHQRLTSYVVMPVMLTELISGGIFFLFVPGKLSLFVSAILFTLIVLIWLSTFFLSVPLHTKLSQGYDTKAAKRLVISNWPRTVLWSLRSGILIFLIS